jgi:hypothetical protein
LVAQHLKVSWRIRTIDAENINFRNYYDI